MSNENLEERQKEEFIRLVDLLKDANVSDKRAKMLTPVIENTSWMKVKLDEARAAVKNSQIVITYNNGGGQSGIRENPLYKGYESLWKSYMAGMNVILNALPQEVVKQETEKATETRTMLEIVRDKHKKQA